MESKATGYQFDDITLDLKNRQLSRRGKVLTLNAKYFDVLVFLVTRHNHLITKDELFENIWSDVIVTDAALSQCIKDIRRVLNDDARNPRYIKTLPKHGFMFLKEPTPIMSEETVSEVEWPFRGIIKRPYKFLDYYTEDDADLFFGRESEIEQICSKILAHRTLVLYGRSGVGKSSIVHAGVLPALKKQGHHVFVVRDYHDPDQELKQAISKGTASNGKLELSQLLNNNFTTFDKQVVCILDQFEEFFNQNNQKIIEKFIQTVGELYRLPGVQFKLLFVVREDLLAEMSQFKVILPEIFHHEYRLQRIDRKHAEEAIVEPAKKVGCEIEPALVKKILDDLTDADYIDPPQLQIVCDTLYDAKNSSSKISLFSYQKLGGAPQILSKYLERVIQRYHAGDMDMAKAILITLVTENKQRCVLPISKLMDQVEYKLKSGDKISQLVEDLADARVVRFRRQDGETWIELTHDFLIPEIIRWQSAEEIAIKRAQAVVDRAIENYKTHQLLLDPDAIELIIPLGERLNLTDDEGDLLARSMLNRGRRLPNWLTEKSPSVLQLIADAIQNDNPDVRISAVESSVNLANGKLQNILTALALWDPDLMVRKVASIVLAEKYGDKSIQWLVDKKQSPKPGLVRRAISLAFIRDYNKRLFRLRHLPLVLVFLVLTGLMWVRLQRNKLEILKQTLGGAFGAAMSGLLAGMILGITLALYRQTPLFESTTSVLVLSSLGTLAGLMAGVGISLGMSAMRSVSYRHSPYWSIVGAVFGGGLIGGILHAIGVDTLQALFGQNLSGIAGAYEGALIGLGLSLGYLFGGDMGENKRWIKIVTAALGAMLAAIMLTLIKGNLFSASIETIANAFVNSQINLQPLANLLGEAHYGQFSRLILGAVEGFLFGGFLTLGLEISRKFGRRDQNVSQPESDNNQT